MPGSGLVPASAAEKHRSGQQSNIKSRARSDMEVSYQIKPAAGYEIGRKPNHTFGLAPAFGFRSVFLELLSAAPALVVLAAGVGSRYGGLKQMEPVGPGGEAVLDYAVFDAKQAGFAKFIFVIRREIEQDFRETFGRRFARHVNVDYALQALDMVPAGRNVPQIGRASCRE